MTLSYDKLADVLYVTFEVASPDVYIYVENANGDVLRMNKRTRQIVGVTVPAFLERSARGKVEIPEVGPVQFNEFADDLLRA